MNTGINKNTQLLYQLQHNCNYQLQHENNTSPSTFLRHSMPKRTFGLNILNKAKQIQWLFEKAESNINSVK